MIGLGCFTGEQFVTGKHDVTGEHTVTGGLNVSGVEYLNASLVNGGQFNGDQFNSDQVNSDHSVTSDKIVTVQAYIHLKLQTVGFRRLGRGYHCL